MKFAVILSGSGVYDGAEIHESVCALLAIKKFGGEYEIFAPDVKQHHVINHITGEEMPESRNVLVEAARIARGNIKSLDEYKAEDYDVLILPGGFGAAKNLSSFAFDGENMTVNSQVTDAVTSTHKLGKPIGAMCISPVILSKLIPGAKLTIGSDSGTANMVVTMGSEHINTDHAQVIVDSENKLFSTPCYMLDADILQIMNGAENIINKIIESLK